MAPGAISFFCLDALSPRVLEHLIFWLHLPIYQILLDLRLKRSAAKAKPVALLRVSVPPW